MDETQFDRAVDLTFRSCRANDSSGDPAEIGAAVAFLCSTGASFVNGVSLAVDGSESHVLLQLRIPPLRGLL